MLLEVELEKRRQLFDFIDNNCIFRANPSIQYFPGIPKGTILPKGISPNYYSWCFYLRRLVHDPKYLEMISNIIADDIIHNIWNGKECKDVQLAGMETSGTPLLIGVQLAIYKRTGKNLNSFTIRSERKNYGLCSWVNGNPTPNHHVIMIDDLFGSGQSVAKGYNICYNEFKLFPARNMYMIVNSSNKETLNFGNVCHINYLFHKNEFDMSYSEEKYWITRDFWK